MSRASSIGDATRPEHPLLADGYAERVARIKAHQLVRRSGFTESDRADIEQELLLDLIIRTPHYDPARASRHTYISRIIEHKVASILEYRFRAKRDPRRVVASMKSPATGGERAESEDVRRDRHGRHVVDTELALDLEAVLRDLPPKLRAVCERLPDSTMQEIADDLGVSRRTVQRRKAELQSIFEETGLGDYL